jgi:hypothetical protein
MGLYLACAVFGGLLLLLQLAGGLVGGDGDAPHAAGEAGDAGAGGHHASPAVQLPTLRTLAAAIAGFGLAGAGLRAAGWPGGVALAGALVTGLVAGAAVAALTRLLLRFESDGTVRLAGAVGLPATVYVPIPRAGGGAGKVTLALQGRLIECEAVSADDAPLATGATVIVVDVANGDTLVVATDPVAAERS